MGTTLIKNCQWIATMDDERREISNGGLFIRDHVIEAVGPMAELPQSAEREIDLSGHVVFPGMVNTHHHLYQTLTRAYVQDGTLFEWLTGLYPVWAGLTGEMMRVSTLTGCAELLLSGCTTASDHHYIFPNTCRLDDQIEAATDIGIRFHASRGSMSLGQSDGGLPPDAVVETEPDIIKDTIRLIETYHDPSRHAMLRIVVAPCSPFSVTQNLMREAADIARSYQAVHLHTHLAETLDEEEFCLATFGQRPVELMETLGWLGSDVWHAHCVHMNPSEIRRFGETGTGVAHCPTSNMRLGSGIAPLLRFLEHGVPVGLGVDGSASNDSSHMLAEARQAMLLQRVQHGPAALTARQALELATRGGAEVLGRDDIGYLAAGMSADLIAFDMNQLAYAGAQHDPIAAVIFCQPQQVSWSMVNGRVVVDEGQLTTLEVDQLREDHNRPALELRNQ